MLSTVLIVGFIGVSFVSALVLFAACVAVGRTDPYRVNTQNRFRSTLSANQAPIIDVEWRRLDEQAVA